MDITSNLANLAEKREKKLAKSLNTCERIVSNKFQVYSLQI